MKLEFDMSFFSEELLKAKQKISKPLVIWDLDSTLADCTHRMPKKTQAEMGHQKWLDELQQPDKMVKDPIIKHTKFIYNTMDNKANHIIVTGRKEKYRDVTEKWLKENGIKYDALYMRGNEDNSEAGECKSKYIKKILKKYKSQLVLAFDDDYKKNTESVYHKNGIHHYKLTNYK